MYEVQLLNYEPCFPFIISIWIKDVDVLERTPTGKRVNWDHPTEKSLQWSGERFE